ncbi:MAG: type II toxin-antitoxin system VapC family toxin [Acidobacteriota bacterium]
MKLLLDTHTFIWFIMGSSNLSAAARSLIEDLANEKFISTASLWEMAIKCSIGKLNLNTPFSWLIPSQITNNGFDFCPIEIAHLHTVATLPFHHRDPFDRMLIAQAIVENLPIISADITFDGYPIKRLW